MVNTMNEDFDVDKSYFHGESVTNSQSFGIWAWFHFIMDKVSLFDAALDKLIPLSWRPSLSNKVAQATVYRHKTI